MSAHVIADDGPICPEAETRAALTDDEFWQHVLQGERPSDDEDGPDLDDMSTSYQNDPCPECGEHGACAYDAEGRPMVHITEREDE